MYVPGVLLVLPVMPGVCTGTSKRKRRRHQDHLPPLHLAAPHGDWPVSDPRVVPLAGWLAGSLGAIPSDAFLLFPPLPWRSLAPAFTGLVCAFLSYFVCLAPVVPARLQNSTKPASSPTILAVLPLSSLSLPSLLSLSFSLISPSFDPSCESIPGKPSSFFLSYDTPILFSFLFSSLLSQFNRHRLPPIAPRNIPGLPSDSLLFLPNHLSISVSHLPSHLTLSISSSISVVATARLIHIQSCFFPPAVVPYCFCPFYPVAVQSLETTVFFSTPPSAFSKLSFTLSVQREERNKKKRREREKKKRKRESYLDCPSLTYTYIFPPLLVSGIILDLLPRLHLLDTQSFSPFHPSYHHICTLFTLQRHTKNHSTCLRPCSPSPTSQPARLPRARSARRPCLAQLDCRPRPSRHRRRSNRSRRRRCHRGRHCQCQARPTSTTTVPPTSAPTSSSTPSSRRSSRSSTRRRRSLSWLPSTSPRPLGPGSSPWLPSRTISSTATSLLPSLPSSPNGLPRPSFPHNPRSGSDRYFLPTPKSLIPLRSPTPGRVNPPSTPSSNPHQLPRCRSTSPMLCLLD